MLKFQDLFYIYSNIHDISWEHMKIFEINLHNKNYLNFF